MLEYISTSPPTSVLLSLYPATLPLIECYHPLSLHHKLQAPFPSLVVPFPFLLYPSSPYTLLSYYLAYYQDLFLPVPFSLYAIHVQSTFSSLVAARPPPSHLASVDTPILAGKSSGCVSVSEQPSGI